MNNTYNDAAPVQAANGSFPLENAPRPLNKQDVKTLSLASLGGALEYYDFIIYVFFATIISQVFFPATLDTFWAQLNTYGAFAAGYFARPLGGVIMAHFGDLIGRKRMFTLSILLMALPTLCIGLLPTFNTLGYMAPILLLCMRILQGIAIGGEIPSAWVFVSEHVPARRVGLANGLLTSGLTLGILFGSLMTLAIRKNFTEAEIIEYAWRIPFIVGGVLGFVTMYLRRYLEETPVFQEMRARKELHKGLPLKEVFANYKTSIIVSCLLTWLLTAGIVVVILLTPQLMQQAFGIDPITSFLMQSAAIISLTFGCIFTGILCDKIGSGKTFIIMGAVLAISSMIFYQSLGHASLPVLSILYIITGFAVGVVGAVPYVMVHAFPANIRLSGLSFSYNIAYAVFGGLTPLLVTWLNSVTTIGSAYYVLFLCILGICCGVFLLRREK